MHIIQILFLASFFFLTQIMSGQETNLDSPIDLIQNSYAELDSLM